MSMGYYQVQLDQPSTYLTGFTTPFGVYRYLRLPMGVSSAPDIFQYRIEQLIGHLEKVFAYLDDVTATTELGSEAFDIHLKLIGQL